MHGFLEFADRQDGFLPKHRQEWRCHQWHSAPEAQPIHFVGAGLALPQNFAGSNDEKLQGQGKPSPYERSCSLK
jgi:hypothetical protein